MADTGCRTNVIDREKFSKIKSLNLNIVLKRFLKKICSYALQSVKVVDKFSVLL